jgi:hypothetical protein
VLLALHISFVEIKNGAIQLKVILPQVEIKIVHIIYILPVVAAVEFIIYSLAATLTMA